MRKLPLKSFPAVSISLWIFAGSVLCSSSSIAENVAPISVFSEKNPDYHRTPGDGNQGFVPETYVVGKGVCLDPETANDSISSDDFWMVANVLSEALYEADYVPAPEPEKSDLMIVINWGRTSPHDQGLGGGFGIDSLASAMSGVTQSNELVKQSEAVVPTSREDPTPQTTEMRNFQQSQLSQQYQQLEQLLVMQGMGQQVRDEANAFNARLLGYHEVLQRADELRDSVTPLRNKVIDIVNELESPRYFVILQAYDFQSAFQKKQRKLLWTTRFSIRAKGRSFHEELRNMAIASARYIGTDSKSLKRKVSAARVEFGEMEYLGVEEK